MSAESAPVADVVRIYVTFEGFVEMSPNEVWSEGDAPAEVTAEAVKRVMERCGYKGKTLNDWELLDGLEVHVSIGTGDAVEVWRKGWRYRQAEHSDGSITERTDG